MQAHSGTFSRSACIADGALRPRLPRRPARTIDCAATRPVDHARRNASAFLRSLCDFNGRSFVHVASLIFVWLAIATSGIVFREPAPTDALMFGLIVLLPAVGLIAISPMLTAYLSLWLIVGAAGLVAATFAPEPMAAVKFSGVSIYLYVASFVMAAFVARNQAIHTELIFKAWLGRGIAGVGCCSHRLLRGRTRRL